MFLFEIHSTPVAQKQTRFCRVGETIRTYDPSCKEKEMIQWQVKAYAPPQPLTCPVKLDLTFYLPIPKSTSSSKRRQMINQVIVPMVKPDVDNLGYLITNSLKKIFYNDDAQIVDLCMRKRYGEEPKTVVKVIPIINSEQTKVDNASSF